MHLHTDGRAVARLCKLLQLSGFLRILRMNTTAFTLGVKRAGLSPLGSAFLRTVTCCLTLFWSHLKSRGPAQVVVPTPCADEVLCQLSFRSHTQASTAMPWCDFHTAEPVCRQLGSLYQAQALTQSRGHAGARKGKY